MRDDEGHHDDENYHHSILRITVLKCVYQKVIENSIREREMMVTTNIIASLAIPSMSTVSFGMDIPESFTRIVL